MTKIRIVFFLDLLLMHINRQMKPSGWSAAARQVRCTYDKISIQPFQSRTFSDCGKNESTKSFTSIVV